VLDDEFGDLNAVDLHTAPRRVPVL
jgi:hypothetical protein